MANEGNELYQLLIKLTGLDPSQVKKEIDPILAKLDMSPKTLTMEDVRKAMIVYLEEFSAQISPDEAGEFAAELDSLDDVKRIEA